MPCARKPKAEGPDDMEKKILGVLKNASQPMGCGDIAKALNVEVAKVMGKLRGMKTKGLVDSPEKGKYVITEEGKKVA
jgi:Mn-dependent DtxR family transcriptional regulator|uniref:MarR family transcriptional regulator n=1 Tax=candidate division WOR-3 bacterium TaxID=2052148 RepID=A0A7V3KMP1_UNCW3